MKVCIFKDSVKTYKVLQDQEIKDLKFHFKIYMKYLLITNITSKKKRTVGTMLCDNWSDYLIVWYLKPITSHSHVKKEDLYKESMKGDLLTFHGFFVEEKQELSVQIYWTRTSSR